MKNELVNLIESKSPGSHPLLLVIRGSHAYGTNVETSDVDYSGVFIQNMDSLLGNSYVEQINDDSNDIVIYEVRRFLELLAKNNPTVLELLNTPEDCIIYKHPLFDDILKHRDKFITKACGNAFGGYAFQQIKKAKGQDKKQNWEKDRVTRKSPMDFCYLHLGEKSISLSEYLSENNLDQKFCGLSNIPHSRDLYALFYDRMSDFRFSELRHKWERFLSNLFDRVKPLGFKGIAFEYSNDIRLSSIPKNLPKSYFIGYISYNKDGYSQHCKDFKSYQDWLDKRNLQRWVDVEEHGQKIDGKNMMHCVRLVRMSREIVDGRGIMVRRQDASELLDIRKGKVDLQSIIDSVENDIDDIFRLYRDSDLPDSVDMNFVEDLLISIRKNFYKL
jgi:uncharacterized protein